MVKYPRRSSSAKGIAGGAGRKTLRVVRGGSFNNNAVQARCAYRNTNNPDNEWNNNGFRVVGGASQNSPI